MALALEPKAEYFRSQADKYLEMLLKLDSKDFKEFTKTNVKANFTDVK